VWCYEDKKENLTAVSTFSRKILLLHDGTPGIIISGEKTNNLTTLAHNSIAHKPLASII